jgi:hypothetical protein
MAGSATEPERSDEELAAADIGGNLIVVIQCPVWSRARTAGLEHAVLVAAEDRGPEAVNALRAKLLAAKPAWRQPFLAALSNRPLRIIRAAPPPSRTNAQTAANVRPRY